MRQILRLILLLPLCVAANAQTSHGSAGLIAHACVAGEARYLLAFDLVRNRQAWGHLGGRAEGNETPFETATREFHEESNCVYDLQALRQEPSSPQASCAARFCSFSLKVPYKPIADIAQSRACVDVEREQWVWVGHQALMQALSGDEAAPRVPTLDGTPQEVPLWSRAVTSLRLALKEGVLAAKDPCGP